MRHYLRLITLQLLCGTFIGTAHADTISPDQATELLAKSQTINRKCNFLTEAEAHELSGLVARAEIALATQESVADASSALARGRASGKAATCNDAEREEVSSILGAAKIAALQAPKPEMKQAALAPQPVPQMEPPANPAVETPVAMVEPATNPPAIMTQPLAQTTLKKRVPTSELKKVALKKPEPKPAAMATSAKPALANYAALTQRYYLQRRCGTMGSQAINALYQNVVATHMRTLQAYGKAQTAAAMRRAEAQASQQSCT